MSSETEMTKGEDMGIPANSWELMGDPVSMFSA